MTCLFVSFRNVSVYTFLCLVSFAVPSEAAMGEHERDKISLGQQDAVPALAGWTVHSEKGETLHLSELLPTL